MLETEGAELLIVKFTFNIKTTTPIVATNYTGHITNAIAKKLLAVEEPLQHLISVTPIYDKAKNRYIIENPVALPPGQYRFSVTCPPSDIRAAVSLARPTTVEIEGQPCKVESIELSTVDLQTLRAPPYPQRFELEFNTPTLFGKKPASRLAGMAVYELLPTPCYLFGSLSNLWNKIVRQELRTDTREYVDWVSKHIHVAPPIQIRSRTVRLGGSREIPGFMGRAAFISTNTKTVNHVYTLILARLSEHVGAGKGRRLGFGMARYREEIQTDLGKMQP